MVYDISKFISWDKEKNNTYNNYDFILPDISIGNVGQLTVDLLLNNLATEHLGRISHPCFYPFIGSDPFNSESKRLASSCELYECQEKKLIILQIRSRVFPSKFLEFLDLVFHLIKLFNFKQTIVVTSGASEYFSAEQLQKVPLHYLSTSKFSDEEILKQLKWKQFSLPDNVDISDKISIPGSFISPSLLEKCEEESIPLICLICLCSEGDNIPEALQTINCMNSWLELKEVKASRETWKIPISWELPYGSAAPHTIY